MEPDLSHDRNALPLRLEDYPLIATDTIRYADTDRQGHVNNAVFSTFLETGRTQFLVQPDDPITLPGCTFVIANLNLDYLAELTWPGEVKIGSAVLKIGGSSIQFAQAIFQSGKPAAAARTVIVQVHGDTGRPVALSDEARERLQAMMLR